MTTLSGTAISTVLSGNTTNTVLAGTPVAETGWSRDHVTIAIATGTDDGYLRDTTTFSNTGTTIILGYYATGNYRGFWRFSPVNIPKDAIILEASLNLVAAASASTTLYAYFFGANKDDAGALAAYGDYATEMAVKTTATNIVQFAAWTSGTQYDYNMVEIIREITTRAGWVSGNHILIGCELTFGTGTRTCHSHNAVSAANRPTLYVRWRKSV